MTITEIKLDLETISPKRLQNIKRRYAWVLEAGHDKSERDVDMLCLLSEVDRLEKENEELKIQRTLLEEASLTSFNHRADMCEELDSLQKKNQLLQAVADDVDTWVKKKDELCEVLSGLDYEIAIADCEDKIEESLTALREFEKGEKAEHNKRMKED